MSINATTVTVPSSAKLPSSRNEGWLGVINHGGNVGLRRVPLTLFLSMIALAAFIVPDLASALQLDFASVASGQWWRLITGHLTHYGGDHLFWDLLMFAVLGAVCEHQHPRLFGLSVIVMSVGISATVLATCSDVSAYRGLSGIDTGLCVWFIIDQIRQSLASRDRVFTVFWTTAGTFLIGKLVFEFATGEILFVDANGFKPLVESHLAGAVLGVVISLTQPNRNRRMSSTIRNACDFQVRCCDQSSGKPNRFFPMVTSITSSKLRSGKVNPGRSFGLKTCCHAKDSFPLEEELESKGIR